MTLRCCFSVTRSIALLALVWSGCVASPRDDIFVCATDDDCPPGGFACREGYCTRSRAADSGTRDAGVDRDAATADAGDSPDAGVDGGTVGSISVAGGLGSVAAGPLSAAGFVVENGRFEGRARTCVESLCSIGGITP